jgi:dihydrofolate synthase/folylpolyglutamate synthase
MTYQATLDYLFSQLPMFSRIGAAAYKDNLDNTWALCSALGNPQEKFRSIHVAGTNGKGSVCHMLAAVLQEAGYKTGLYTSPHLYDFRERIRINGVEIPEPFVVEFTERVKGLIEQIQPSFFEITVAMAFCYFVEEEVDIAVIETGLGGRLDSTNVITPLLSIITNIGWDHMNLLGNTLTDIAYEKAGIIKAGVPVVIGENQIETAMVFLRACLEKNAPLACAEDEYKVTTISYSGINRCVELRDEENGKTEFLELDLPGLYQEKNIITVRKAIDVIRAKGFEIPGEIFHAALRKVRTLTGLAGRWETLRDAPRLVLDVAHNRDGLAQIKLQLQEEKYSRLHLVFGMVRDKEAASTFPLLPSADFYYFTQAHIPRALPAQELADAARKASLKGDSFEDVNEAVEAALQNAHADDFVLVCGSIFVVAEVDKKRFTQ